MFKSTFLSVVKEHLSPNDINTDPLFFYLFTEETFIISTSGLLPNGREIHVILSEKQKYYDFGVRACESAKVILTSGQSASPVLELELGNTFTRLFQDSNLLTQAMTPGKNAVLTDKL